MVQTPSSITNQHPASQQPANQCSASQPQTSQQQTSHQQLVADLAERLRQWEQTARDVTRSEVHSSTCPELDGLLPQRGFARGSLIEWVSTQLGAGATVLALMAARAICGDEGWLAIVDSAGTFFPPAAAALGIRLENVLLIRPAQRADAFWAIDQALRCRGLSAVLAWPETLDHRTFRRWQLAAEQSGVIGLLVRPHRARSEPSWAEARLLVEPLVTQSSWRRWRIELLHARGVLAGKTIEVASHHEIGNLIAATATHPLPLVPSLAHPATPA